jgi:WD40 repeat protein
MTTRRLITRLTDPSGQAVASVAFSRDGTLLATGDSDGRTYLWSVSAR